MIRPELYRHPGDAANREKSVARDRLRRPRLLRGWRTQYCVDATSAKRLRQSVLCYQGIPLRSGTFAVDCSGRPPDMRIKAIIRTPVHPPPTNATISHQTETILA